MKKITSDLSDYITKGIDSYPETRQQMLLMLDKYTKKPAMITPLEGTAFVQKGRNSGKSKKADDGNEEKIALSEYDKEYFKDKMCFRCGKMGHLKSACKAKLTKDDSSTWSSK